jgi:acyl-CoA synthetase (AMP-forming)/AMP-acid ligase II
VLVDPGMGRKHLVGCLEASVPAGFVAISPAQAVRALMRRRFPAARLNVTVGRRWFWGGATYGQLLARGRASTLGLPATHADDAAAIIFTSGSTGPPKGVLYTHRMFDAQAAEIQRAYDLQPGGVDLSCFALFGLFNSAWGVTTVFPEMDFARPAAADPVKLLAAGRYWKVTQAFASPAVWDKLGRHCEASGERLPTLQKVFSCGAPVGAEVIRRTLDHVAAPDARMHTPYGATEALPVSTIEAREVLRETAALTSKGAGVCVGRKFDSIDWRVIRITDGPIASIDGAEQVPAGEIGELIVRGPQVSPAYVVDVRFQSPDLPMAEMANAVSKIRDGDGVWHRMGDVGRFDPQGRFWYYGRKSQRVETGRASLFTESVEATFNAHPAVRRCALVRIGTTHGATPAIVVESNLPALQGHSQEMLADFDRPIWDDLVSQLKLLAAASPTTCEIDKFLLIPELPVDVRHNAKINREALAAWASQHLETNTRS